MYCGLRSLCRLALSICDIGCMQQPQCHALTPLCRCKVRCEWCQRQWCPVALTCRHHQRWRTSKLNLIAFGLNPSLLRHRLKLVHAACSIRCISTIIPCKSTRGAEFGESFALTFRWYALPPRRPATSTRTACAKCCRPLCKPWRKSCCGGSGKQQSLRHRVALPFPALASRSHCNFVASFLYHQRLLSALLLGSAL